MSKAVEVAVLPTCDICGKAKARYDIRTWTGRWGNACPTCWPQVRATPDLGTGKGQYLFTAGEVIPPHAR